jgi:hypothetical protein
MLDCAPTETQSERSAADELEYWRAKKAKRLCLLGLLILAAVGGVLDEVVPSSRNFDRLSTVVSSVIGVLLVFMWCHYDSWQRSCAIGKPLRLLIIFVAFVGVPVYLLRTRGFRGLLSVVLGGVFLALMGVVALFASEVTSWLCDLFQWGYG